MGKALEGIWKAVLEFFDLSHLQFEEVHIASDVVDSICHFSKEVHPKEFIAILKGEVRDNVLHVDNLIFQPFRNTRHSTQVRLDLPMVSGSVGSVHSHPSPSNRPSQQDLAFFGKMGGIHLIICSPYRRQDIQAYLPHGTAIPFSVSEHAFHNRR